jgi:hypothetical protein
LYDAPIRIRFKRFLQRVHRPSEKKKAESLTSVAACQRELAIIVEMFMMVVKRPRHWFRLEASRYR